MKENKYILSIIVPVYNSSKYLPRFLKSVISQKVDASFEVVFIDDGSLDNSVQVIHKYCRGRINYRILRQENKKQAAARNFGLDVARGKYIYLCDSDDKLTNGCLKNMLDAMENNNAELYVCGVKIQFPKKTYIDSCFVFRQSKHIIEKYVTQNSESDVGLWNKCFVNKVIQKYNIRFDNGNFFEDSLFVLEYLSVIDLSKIYYTKFVGYILYKNNGSTTRSFKAEIDILAKDYIDKASKILRRYNFPSKVNIGFQNRINLHVLHHHIIFDKNFSDFKLKRYTRGRLLLKKFGGMLTFKYRLSVFFAWLFPRAYKNLYYHWKG
ncbi:glycosyl transferase 2 family protein [Secundilactobacillus pentosiphilus]|uniref:Glycosyl transferase 2 family protein n=1 Tax=Secundilactobacillus pentosiphilus TaxID=1714682 RepID=A0A1Z5ISC2_9LACO|nr:glycosyltransferase family 2 protein [Secundilactobacillus pentosiphilus]GAX04674.1 glycosyl transferase 2 family protein [Secundilactobacillus pentosiphilus]